MANETKIYVGEQGAKALYKRLKEQLGKITTYQKVTNVTQDGVPIVAKPNTRTIYLVKDETVIGDDKYKEWIWNSVDLWECIGTTSIPENAWKQWSEDNGSTGSADSVYIGKNIVLGRDESYSLGKGNVVEVTDDTDYTDTDVAAIGTNNTATNAANAYQLGRENSVIDNNLAAKLDYPHSMALNLGRNNIITGEGVNVGKDNNATTFGINIGQNNFSSNASCSVGQHVMSDHSSLSLGNANPTLATATVGNVPSMLVNGKYEHVQRFKLKDRYHLCERATIYQDPADNKYKWAAIQSTQLRIYPNYELDQYLVSWGSGRQSGTITGYYDEEGVFHESSDTSHNIHTYGRITYVGNPSGSSRVSLNPPFYANYVNQEETQNYIVYVMRAEITLPAYGTILTRSEYEALIAGAVTPVMRGSVYDLFINLDDLTADGYTVPKLASTNALPFPLTYEVYGYKDNNVLIPYNELNKDETHDFDWYEVDWSVIQGNTLPVKQVNPRAELIVADDRSATFGMGSLYAGGRSITISTNTISAYQMRYQGTYETNVFHTYTGTRYTIDQETGNHSTTSATISCFTSNNGQFNSKVAPHCAIADGGSIVISNNYATAYGSSIAIGNYANADGFSYVFGDSSSANGTSFAFGKAAFGYDYSMALGFDNAYASKRSIALGIYGVSAQNDSIAIGFNGLSASDHSLAFGYGGSADDKAICIGFSNYATGQSVAIGDNNATSGGGVAIGITNRGLGGATMSGTCIGLGISNSVGGNSFVAGNGCLGSSAGIAIGIGSSAQNGSISLGIGCSGYRGAILLGIGNSTISSDNAYGNAVVMGFGNTVYNVRESLNKTGWTGTVTACGIAIGSYITGYGHNFISFGSKNILGDPAHWSEDGRDTVTDNDGFMTAIGFQCTANRNYDFAYGYQSVANGGENIAFQHSRASGFRNIAMVDATAFGTENISLIESNMTINLPNVTSQCSRNVLHHSTVNHYTSLQSDRLGFNDNILAGSTVNTSGQWVIKNTLIHGAIMGPARVCESNIVLTGSSITLGGSIESVRNNILANNASLVESPYTAFCNASDNHPVSENFLLGTYAQNTYGCFSMSDIDSALRLSNSTRVFNFGDNTFVNTHDATAFGADNDIKGVKFVFTSGCLNTISSEKTYSDDAPGNIYVMGAKNTVKLIDDSSVSEKSRCDRIYVSGIDNTIQGTLLFENYIFGNCNKLQTPSPVQTLTGVEVHGNQIDNVDVSLFKVDSYALEVSIRNDSGRLPTTVQFAAFWLFPNSVYFVDENVIMATSAPSGVTTTPINIDVFIEKLKTNIAELNHKFYTLTGKSQYSTNKYGSITLSESIIPSSIVIYTGNQLLDPTYFYKIYNKTVSRVDIDDDSSSGQIGESDTNKYCARNNIIGNNNNIQSNVTDYTIIGLQNTLYNKLNSSVQPSWSNSISSGFIQGNNNDASNGSNIISMGNGNVSTGHNSVAIGCQLISNQWQTVLGKYNAAIAGPNRLASETPQDPTKALLIVGNGYSTKDDSNWQDESFITRSNALELYADGRLKISGKIEASNIPTAPVADGQYALACEVVNGVTTYRWVAVGIN